MRGEEAVQSTHVGGEGKRDTGAWSGVEWGVGVKKRKARYRRRRRKLFLFFPPNVLKPLYKETFKFFYQSLSIQMA